ncbi:hypothetical protein GMJAKD_00480 [Candidatus Electrothrix aarhusensis]
MELYFVNSWSMSFLSVTEILSSFVGRDFFLRSNNGRRKIEVEVLPDLFQNEALVRFS